MITTAELHRLAEEEGLRFDQAEKDYIILWVLAGLMHSGITRNGWVFKGGTYYVSQAKKLIGMSCYQCSRRSAMSGT